MSDRQALIDGTKKIQQTMQRIDLKMMGTKTILDLAESIRALAAIVEVVVEKIITS